MDGRNHADEAFSVTSAPTQWITRSSTAWSAPCTGLRWMRGAHSPRLLGRIREVGPWLGLCQRGAGGGHGYWRSWSQTSQGGHVVHGRHLLGPGRQNYDAHSHTPLLFIRCRRCDQLPAAPLEGLPSEDPTQHRCLWPGKVGGRHPSLSRGCLAVHPPGVDGDQRSRHAILATNPWRTAQVGWRGC